MEDACAKRTSMNVCKRDLAETERLVVIPTGHISACALEDTRERIVR